jgi:hypothetical protein
MKVVPQTKRFVKESFTFSFLLFLRTLNWENKVGEGKIITVELKHMFWQNDPHFTPSEKMSNNI